MSWISEIIGKYKEGDIELAELADKLAHGEFKPSSVDKSPEAILLRAAQADPGEFPEDGTWDEVAAAHARQTLSDEEYLVLVKAADAAHPIKK